MARKAKEQESPFELIEMRIGHLTVNLIGETPLIMHRQSQKDKQGLLLPAPEKNRAARAATLKHDPIGEFRASVYLNRDDKTPTLLHFPSNAFGKAMADVALDYPGATKTRIGRLTGISSVDVFVYGIPEVFIRPVRLSGINKAPDIRTRAILSEWCCSVTIRYSASHFKEGEIIQLVNAAGMFRGIGDWRPEKGGDYGTWKLVNNNDADMKALMKNCGRKAQVEALKNPVCFDPDSEEMLTWFGEETKRREIVLPSSKTFKIYDGENGRIAA